MNTSTSNIQAAKGQNKPSEDDLRERIKELEETCRFLQQQVATARHQLLHTNKMVIVGQMLATVAHELNNPLNGVLGYSQLLMKQGIDDRSHNSLQIIEAEATRARNIVQTLLNFVRAHEPKHQIVSVNQIIKSMVDIRKHHRHINHIELSMDLDAWLPLTFAEPHQLGQVILNLVSNAEQALIDTSYDGEIHVKTTRVTHEDREAIRIVVRDTGPGMPPDVLNCIFDPFFTTRDTGEGTGLGLSICKQIVEEHHGKITAESREGEGTMFTIELPVTNEKDTTPESTVVPATDRAAPGRGLVIDDEPVVCQYVEDACKTEGHEMDAVTGAQEAFEAIKKNHYDFVICDLKMPKINGQTFYDVVKSYDERLSRRIIFITGDSANLKTEQFLKETGNYYIYKPFQLHELIAMVNRVLTEQQ